MGLKPTKTFAQTSKKKIEKKAEKQTEKQTEKKDLIVLEREKPIVVKPANLTKKQRKSLDSMFGESSDTIIDFIDMNNQDGANSLIYKALLKTMVEVIALSEHNVRVTEGARGIYGFNQLVSQIRELLADIRSQQDSGEMIEQVVQRILVPAFTDIGMQVVLAMTQVANICRSDLTDEKFARLQDKLNNITQEMSRFMSDRYRKSVEDVHKAFT